MSDENGKGVGDNDQAVGASAQSIIDVLLNRIQQLTLENVMLQAALNEVSVSKPNQAKMEDHGAVVPGGNAS